MRHRASPVLTRSRNRVTGGICDYREFTGTQQTGASHLGNPMHQFYVRIFSPHPLQIQWARATVTGLKASYMALTKISYLL